MNKTFAHYHAAPYPLRYQETEGIIEYFHLGQKFYWRIWTNVVNVVYLSVKLYTWGLQVFSCWISFERGARYLLVLHVNEYCLVIFLDLYIVPTSVKVIYLNFVESFSMEDSVPWIGCDGRQEWTSWNAGGHSFLEQELISLWGDMLC